MLTQEEAQGLIGAEAYGSDGTKIGRIGQVFLDDQSGQPEFITVNTGLFGNNESFVPVADASRSGDRLTVPFTKDKVKDAPNVAVDGGHLSQEEERRLYEYYGMSYSEATSDTGLPQGDAPGTVGHDVSGPTTDDAMTRSEEQMRVGTTEQEAGRARLRKYVTTEQQTHTVPVTKERAVLETEPITDSNVERATSGPDISEEEHEVTLSEERPVVEKTTQPVERVRLGKEQVTQQETVGGEVRKERIEAEGDLDDRT